MLRQPASGWRRFEYLQGTKASQGASNGGCRRVASRVFGLPAYIVVGIVKRDGTRESKLAT